MTSQEVKLWVHLHSWRKRGYHFRRQSPREGFIVDFVCMKHELVIELDGGQHNLDEHQERDAMRDALRFWNNVDRNLDGVLQTIDMELRQGPPHPAAVGGHPPPAGEG